MKELVLSAKAGNQDAWDTLYNNTAKNAYFVALNICGKEQDAMDMVHEAFVTALERIDSLNEPEKFQSWLNMIVANKCRDYLKKKKPSLFSEYETEDGPAFDWEDDYPENLPEQHLDHQETIRLVSEMIDDLPEDQKLCIILYYRDELSVSAIAQSLQISEGTVKSRLNYARSKIKTKVEDLAKRGTKLYGLAPLPFLSWLLRSGTESTTLPSGLSAPIIVSGTSKGISISAGTSSTVSSASTATVSGGKALASGMISKVAAGILAVGVTIGGFSVYQSKKEVSPPIPESPAVSVDTAATAPAVSTDSRETVMEKYDQLLAQGTTESGLQIKYFAYLDLDHNDIPELLVSNQAGTPEDWSEGELYSFSNGELQLCTTTGSRYDHFYLVNDTYLMGQSRMGKDFYSTDTLIRTSISHWNPEMTLTAPAVWINGEFQHISEDEFDYYNQMPEQVSEPDRDHFIQTATPITLEKNPYTAAVIEIQTRYFTLELPDSWADKYVYFINDDTPSKSVLPLCEKENFHAGVGGELVSIGLWPTDEDYSHLPSYEIIDACEVDGVWFDILALIPTDVCFLSEYQTQYMELSENLLSKIHIK